MKFITKPIDLDRKCSLTKKQYNRMKAKHKKALRKVVKNFQPYDYGYFMDVLYEMLSYMKDYYIGGYNVWQSDESLTPLIESLVKAYNAAKELQNNNYDAPINEFHLAHPFKDINEPYTDEQREKLKSAYNESERIKIELYSTLFNTIRDHIEEWWD